MRLYSCFGRMNQRDGDQSVASFGPADKSAVTCLKEPKPLPTLILLRHGQSQWNLEDRFTGWVDVDLTPEGEAQARKGGELIKAEGLDIDRCFTSVLTRAIRTSWLALAAADQGFVPEVNDWRLN